MYGEHETSGEHSNAIGWILQGIQILGAAVFTWQGVAKIVGQDSMVELFQTLGFGQWLRLLVGGLEILCALMLVLPPSARAGAVFLGALMVGAIVIDVAYLHVTPALPLMLLLLMILVVVLKRKKKHHAPKHSFASR